ncbi:MAG: lactate racemase domain-containing protein [Candidatus Bathyarchaeia archaeon]
MLQGYSKGQVETLEIWIPYGDTEVPVGVPAENLAGIVEPKDTDPVGDLESMIQDVFSGQEGVKPSSQVCRSGARVTVFTDLPSIASSFDAVNLVVKATRHSIDFETLTVFWRHIGEPRVRTNLEGVGEQGIQVVDIYDHDTFAPVGRGGSMGEDAQARRELAEADLRILVSHVRFHPILGRLGGRSILLSLLDEQTKIEICREAVRSYLEGGSFEIEEQLRRDDTLKAISEPTLALSFVIDKKGRVSRMFGGALDDSFRRAVEYVDDVSKAELSKPSDVIVVGPGGRPYDYTLSRSLESMMLNMRVLKKGCGVVLVAECFGGYGSEIFRDLFSKGHDMKQLRSVLKRDPSCEAVKAHFLMRLLEDHRVYLVSVMPDYYARGVFRLKTSRTVNDALQSLLRGLGKDSSVAVLPYGSSTIASTGTMS